MAYEIIVESYFSAAHYLRQYKGKCENLHGHNWKVQVVIVGEDLDKTGMVLDFNQAKKDLNKTLSQLDHKHINKVAFFKVNNPTSERIAEFIFREYKKMLKAGLVLKSVTVWETPTSSARYYTD